MIRRPPRSTLFPYTRSSDLVGAEVVPQAERDRRQLQAAAPYRAKWCVVVTLFGRGVRHASMISNPATASSGSTGGGAPSSNDRSEEHTSELQSLAYLVCRLL